MAAESDTIAHLLRRRAREQTKRTAFTFLADGETQAVSLTYGELDRAASKIAARLLQQAEPGDRALLLFPSGVEFLQAFFACLYAGIIAVPIYPPRRNRLDQRILSVVEDASARLALTSSSILADMQRRMENVPALNRVAWLATDGDEVGSQMEYGELAVPSDGLAMLQYTSGSTSTPKGVMLTHENLVAQLAQLDERWEHSAGSVMVSWLPAFHDMGLVYGLLEPLFAGFPCFFMPPAAFFQRPLLWLAAISRYRATHSAAPNFAYDMCVELIGPEERAQLDLTSWQSSINGAEPVRARTLTEFDAAFSACGLRRGVVRAGYGLAEATLAVSSVRRHATITHCRVRSESLAGGRVVETADEENAQTLVSCGPVLTGSRVAIVDPQTRAPCPIDRVGEIWVAGPSVARGYWNHAQTTAEVFHAHLADTGEGPWLRTGDLGFMKHHELFITGRIKDLIIIRGQNVYPQDIERTVEQCHPALVTNGCAAFGIEAHGEERLVVAQEVARVHIRSLDVDQVVRAIRESVLEQHALPLHAVVLLRTASIPKTSSGKIQRHACRRDFLAGTLNVVGQWYEA